MPTTVGRLGYECWRWAVTVERDALDLVTGAVLDRQTGPVDVS